MQGWQTLWEARIDRRYRLILRLDQDEKGSLFILEDAGPHDIYKKKY